MKFVLASKSPRRARLLEQLGIPFEQQSSDLEEIWDPDQTPEDNVQRLAREKAASVISNWPDALILGSDTSVVHGDKVLGKPETQTEAAQMLRSLSGSSHRVLTGVGLIRTESDGSIANVYQFYTTTTVRFAHMSDEEIESYVASGSPMDKAGAYGIQDDTGALFVQEIQGDYYNVVGLPLQSLYQTLKLHFPDVAKQMWARPPKIQKRG